MCVIPIPLITVGTKSKGVKHTIHLAEVSRISLHFTNVPLTCVCHSVAKTRPGYVQIIGMGDYLRAKRRAVFHVDTGPFVFTSL